MENDGSRSSNSRRVLPRQINTLHRNDHVEKLRRLLTRFTKTELLTEVPDVCKLTMDSLTDAKYMDKDQVVDRLTSLIQRKIRNLEDVIPLIQLKYMQNHAKSRTWSALKVQNASKLVTQNAEREKFAESLETFLNRSEFFCKVFSSFWQEALWTVIIFSQQGVMQDLYLVHCIDAPFVMYCALRVSHQDVLFRALMQTYRGNAIQQYRVKARDIHSLLRICIQKSMEQFNPSAFPSVVRKSLRKRKEERTEKLPSNVVDEEMHDVLRRKKYLKENFNSYELPCLESLSYAAKTEYFGTLNQDEIVDSHCTVHFKGQNVLEGIHTMVRMRQTACPLPDYLIKVPSSGCNSFLVTTQQNEELNSRTSH